MESQRRLYSQLLGAAKQLSRHAACEHVWHASAWARLMHYTVSLRHIVAALVQSVMQLCTLHAQRQPETGRRSSTDAVHGKGAEC